MLCQVKRAADPRAALDRLRAVEPFAVDGSTADEMAEGCELLDLIEDGATVGAVAIHIAGTHATINAAASRGQATYTELEAIERGLRAMGVESVQVNTRRHGLVRQLARLGYGLREATLHKELSNG